MSSITNDQHQDPSSSILVSSSSTTSSLPVQQQQQDSASPSIPAALESSPPTPTPTPTPLQLTKGNRHQSVILTQAEKDDEEAKSPKVSPLTSLIAGFLAGTVSRTTTAPLDRIKVLAQEGRVQMKRKMHPTVHIVEDPKKKPVNFRQTAMLVYRDGGMKAFWRGNGANCLKAGPELGLVFCFRTALMERARPWTNCEIDFLDYDFFQFLPEFTSTQRTIAANFITSAAAGFGAQIIVYPLETTKTRIAVATSGEYSGILDCVMQSYQRGGVKDFYKGLVANLTGIVPYRGLEIGCFFTLQNMIMTSRLAYFHKQEVTEKDKIAPGHRGRHEEVVEATSAEQYASLSLMEVAGVGMAASVFAQTLTYPLNLVRTRLQTQGVNGRPSQYKNMRHCFQSIWRAEGFTGLFRGIGANFLKAVPASVLTFMIVDRFQRFVAHRERALRKKLEIASQKAAAVAASTTSRVGLVVSTNSSK